MKQTNKCLAHGLVRYIILIFTGKDDWESLIWFITIFLGFCFCWWFQRPPSGVQWANIPRNYWWKFSSQYTSYSIKGHRRRSNPKK